MPLNLTEARERARLLSDIRTVVHLDLTSTESYRVEAEIGFTCARPGAATFLELASATDVTVEGITAAYDGERIALSDLAADNTVTVRATLPYVTDGDGVTLTTDPADGERYVCAFTAMDVAHRVLPCFDQPDLKTTFTVSVTAPAHWSVLANGRVTGRDADGVDGADGATTRWSFATTPPIATYLFFVGAGPWVAETWDEPYAAAPGGSLPFGWYARASQESALRRDAAELRRITSACFQHYTTIFEPAYPFADYQQVFTPGLNWGAMEFPGCVAFRDEYLVAGTPTAMQREGLATTIAHEMAHMWFGDLVTMRWWEDTWLNESFADFMGYDVAATAAGYDDAWTGAALTRKPTGYRADLRRSSHPVAEDAERLPDVDTAFANFDMITYAKGNAVLRQLGTWIGPDFLAGVNRHLSAHAFGNATLADFLDALDAATDRDVRGWAERWLRTTGFDTIEVVRDGDVPVLSRTGTRPHRLSVAAFDGAREVGRVMVDLADEPVPLPDFAGLAVVANAGDETFASVHADEESWAAVRAHLSAYDEPLVRAVLWWQALERVEAGVTTLTELGTLLTSHLSAERQPIIVEAVLGMVQRIIRLYADPSAAAALQEQVAAVAATALASGDPALAPAAARALASAASDVDLLTGWLSDPTAYVDQAVRWVVVRRLAELGLSEPLAAEEQRDRTVAGHLAGLTARAALASPDDKAASWSLLMSGTLTNHEFTAAATGFWGWDQAELVAAYLERYPVEALALARSSGQAMGQIIGRAFPVLPLAGEQRRRVRDRLSAALQQDVPTVLARAWNDVLDDLDRASASR